MKDYPWQHPHDTTDYQVRIGVHMAEPDCLGEDKPMVAWSEVRLADPQAIAAYDIIEYGLVPA